MNLLVVDQFAETGGAQLCLRDLLPAIRKNGWNVRVFVPCAVTGYSNGRKKLMDVLRYPFDMWQARRAIETAVKEQAVDLVLINGPRVLPAMASLDVPAVFYAHSFLSKRYAQILAGWALRRNSATVIAASRSVARTFEVLAGLQQVRIVYTGVAGCFAPVETSAHLRVGLMGRIAPEKGQLAFIEAARLCPAVRFLIYGSARATDSAYESEVHRQAEKARVEIRGWVENPADAYRELDMVAVPSVSPDAAPRVVLEALSAGKPIVAFPSGGIPEFIENRKTGILTAFSTPEALADAIRLLAGDPELRAQLSRNARRDWEERFQLARYQREICEFLQEAAAAGGLKSRWTSTRNNAPPDPANARM